MSRSGRWVLGVLFTVLGALIVYVFAQPDSGTSQADKVSGVAIGLGLAVLGAGILIAPARVTAAGRWVADCVDDFFTVVGKVIGHFILYVLYACLFVGIPLALIYFLVRFVKWAWTG